MSDLPVPDASLRELHALVETVSGGEVLHGSWEDVHRIAAPVVAAELRRLADVVPVGPARTILLARADQLDRDGDADGDTDV